MKVFLDTNIVLYAFGDDKKSEIARECLNNNPWISTQVVNECSHVMRRKLHWPPARVAHELENVLTLVHLQDVTIRQIRLAWKIAERYGFSHFDSVIVASALKDSGIEWLGEVPKHWEIKRLKNISPFITVGIVVNPSVYVSECGLPFIYGGDITEGAIDFNNYLRITDTESSRNDKTRLSAGDLLTVRVGAPGITAVVPQECEGGNCASVMLTKQGQFNSNWLCYAMNSRMVRYQVEIVQYGAAQEQFNISHAVNFWVATPDQKEQSQIALSLDQETTKLDNLMNEAN